MYVVFVTMQKWKYFCDLSAAEAISFIYLVWSCPVMVLGRPCYCEVQQTLLCSVPLACPLSVCVDVCM